MQANQPCNEPERLAALYAYNILDTPLEAEFDDITQLVAQLCETPIAVINFVAEGRQWFKSEIGLGVRETPLDISICAHAILQDDLFIVPDTTQDPRFADNPLVVQDPHLRFYAGALLKSPDGYPLGTLCVLDYKTRTLTEVQKKALRVLANQVMVQAELRRRVEETRLLNERLRRSMAEAHHRIKNNLQTLTALMDLQSGAGRDSIPISEYQRLQQHITTLASLHDLLTEQAHGGTTSETISMRDSLDKLLPLLTTTAGNRTIHFYADDVRLSLRRATTLALLIAELVSNAVKHGRGAIGISLQRSEETLTLTVTDDGEGFPEGFDALGAANTGLELIETFARYDLRGTTHYGNRPEGGGQVVVTVPLAEIAPAMQEAK